MEIYKFKGLIAAPFTPLDPQGNLNLIKIPELANSLKQNKIEGAFIIGSTGEGVSLTLEEKKKVIDGWAKEQEDNFKVIALIASNSLKEGQELAEFVAKKGLFGLAILPPFYFKVTSPEKLAAYCRELSAVAPSLPIYYYHIPTLSGVFLSMYDFLKEANDIPNLAGIKYTAPDLFDYRKCVTYSEGYYDILWGMDETLIAAMAMGAEGGVGSTYNYAAPLYIEMMEAFREGNIPKAQQLQSKSIAIVDVLVRHGGIATGKYFMKHIGLDCGEFRLPVGGIQDVEGFEDDLRRMGFDRFASVNR